MTEKLDHHCDAVPCEYVFVHMIRRWNSEAFSFSVTELWTSRFLIKKKQTQLNSLYIKESSDTYVKTLKLVQCSSY